MLAAIVRSTALAVLAVLVLATGSANAQDGEKWFEIETINPGLGDAPDDLDRETPQSALEAFLDATRRYDWNRAAHLLDLREIDETDRRRDGARLARQLGEVLERQIWIDWQEVSDRPDALLEQGTKEQALAGQPRRSLRLEILEVDGRQIPIRLNRLKPAEGDAVWLFSRQTVENIPRLHRKYGPGWFEQLVPRDWRKLTALEVRRWELVALPVVLALCIVVFLVLRSGLAWAAGKARWQDMRTAIHAARTPLALFAGAALLQWITTSLLTFSAPITSIVNPLMITAMVVSVTMAVLRAIDTLLDKITVRYVGEIDDAQSSDERQLYTSIYAARRVVLIVAVVVGAGLILSQLHLFETLGLSLLASAGAVAVVVSIAGHSVLGNILASLQIAMAKPVRIGDSVNYEGDWAYVEAIFYTFVRLRTWDGRRLIVPVQYLISKPFENWTMTDARMTRTFSLELDHAAVPSKLREVFLGICRDDEAVMDEEMLKVMVTGHSQAGMTVEFYATAPDPSTAWEMHGRLREKMLDWIRENHPDWWPRDRVVEAADLTRAAAAVE